MSMTSDERREVAARLRKCGAELSILGADCETAFHVIDKVVGCRESDSWEIFLGRLADLIDPREPSAWRDGFDEGYAAADYWYAERTDEELAEHGLKREHTCHNTAKQLPGCFKCSKCGYFAETFDGSDCEPGEFVFCPNCAARVVRDDD